MVNVLIYGQDNTRCYFSLLSPVTCYTSIGVSTVRYSLVLQKTKKFSIEKLNKIFMFVLNLMYLFESNCFIISFVFPTLCKSVQNRYKNRKKILAV